MKIKNRIGLELEISDSSITAIENLTGKSIQAHIDDANRAALADRNLYPDEIEMILRGESLLTWTVSDDFLKT